jgi:hypothetical protein
MRVGGRRRLFRLGASVVLAAGLAALGLGGSRAALAFDEETNPGKPTCSLCTH